MKLSSKLWIALSYSAIASPALAHTGASHADGLVAGLCHPLMGIDHLLAMLSVGVWSAAAIPNKVWAAPAAFTCAMLAGAGLAFAGVGLPGVEGMVAASVLALGLMVAIGAKMPVLAGLGFAGLFAVFNGHAHAVEASGAVIAYVAGFSLSTVAIQMAGVGIGQFISSKSMARYALGLAIAGSGLTIFSGV
ncbi:HupE/UreJ family protein (plasmid) [Rhizobium sp. T1470]|uniref:HupE/UreJ family protein n=1 Tax=unclassified Rhizobium TaxID=2613769 RepID=UPI001AAEA5D8|nr:HupE/UreJ family protein [Rhizobium sp. T1473]MCA0806434.1 HupE/UreJ family protein [Rhizobium sp. T1473]